MSPERHSIGFDLTVPENDMNQPFYNIKQKDDTSKFRK